MSKKLYVGNLPWSVTTEQLEDLFKEYGRVISADVIVDRDTGRSRGFGFVRMEDGADAAMEALNGSDMAGRQLVVNEARERTGGGGGHHGGGGRRY